MLRLRVHADDLVGPWCHRDAVWYRGASRIEPFRHRVIEVVSEPGSDGIRLKIVEQVPDGDRLRIEILNGQLVVSAGSRGTAPLYLTLAGAVLHGSWDAADLHPFVARDQLLDRAIVRLMTRRHRYSTDTVFSGVHRLTERATASFDRNGLELRYPPEAQHVLEARPLRHNSDPVRHFDNLLGRQIEPIVVKCKTGLELSGGVDSANVALSAAAYAQRLPAFGLTVVGPAAVHQRSRRQAIVKDLGLVDVEIGAADHLPFSPGGARSADRPHYADGDVYRESFDALRRHAAAAGVEVMLTGFGGDELMSLRSRERAAPLSVVGPPRWLGERARAAMHAVDINVAPAAPVAVPCLMAFAARHPAYLRWGLWPVAPLAEPQLLRFAESLPVDWRARKRLLRSRLTRHGFGQSVTHPTIRESFGATMVMALQRYGMSMLRAMLEESILICEGFVDRAELARCLRMVEMDGVVPDLLYDTLAVERGLQSMLKPGVVAGDADGRGRAADADESRLSAPGLVRLPDS